MIATSSGGLVDKFLSVAFLDMMSHVCDVEQFESTQDGKCFITEKEVALIPDWFVDDMVDDMEAFDDTGGVPFVKKKIVHLIKIAKEERSIVLDLVNELLLKEIGDNCLILPFMCNKAGSEVVEFPERQQLIDAFLTDENEAEDEEDLEIIRQMNSKAEVMFDSFYTLMQEDDVVLWDYDFMFLSERGVPKGIYSLYYTVPDYDRVWHERPWKDVGEEVPDIVINVLDAVERQAQLHGGLNQMRAAIAMKAAKAMAEEITISEDVLGEILGNAE